MLLICCGSTGGEKSFVHYSCMTELYSSNELGSGWKIKEDNAIIMSLMQRE